MMPKHISEYKDVCKGISNAKFLKFQDGLIDRIRMIQEWGTAIKWQEPTSIRARVWAGKELGSKVIGMVVLPLALNESSLRLRVLASEIDVFSDSIDQIQRIKFKKIEDIREFKKTDAPLIVNWEYLNPKFKIYLFNSSDVEFKFDIYDVPSVKELKQREDLMF